ncbi:hypothetical protein MMC18_000282 [Xylographa bjoerkii]|nr:hypothetical protein [Xylographa bjoerkii]
MSASNTALVLSNQHSKSADILSSPTSLINVKVELEALAARETVLVAELRTVRKLVCDSVSIINELEHVPHVNRWLRRGLINDEKHKEARLHMHITSLTTDLRELMRERAQLQVQEKLLLEEEIRSAAKP